MEAEVKYSSSVSSIAEDLFVELFCDAFGPEKTEYLYVQYPFVDIYGNRRFIDFALESEEVRIAIEIDGERFHNPDRVSSNKYYDDLLKQNSLIYNNWKVYRWAYNQLNKQRDKVKDELITFVGEMPEFRMIEDYLPRQTGKAIELKDHQQSAINNLRGMRDSGESIALLYHATGTGKTVTAVSDAKSCGERTLFLAHTRELVTQARDTFEDIWPDKQAGLYVAENKDSNAYVVCGSIQSVAQNLDQFSPEDFGYIVIDECHHGTANTYKKILGYFKPKFILGLTATPERTDGEDLLELFKNVAHKMNLKTAVEMGELTPIRCIRVKTNIDLSTVRINGIKYHSQDLESKLFIPERNSIIVNTYLEFVKNTGFAHWAKINNLKQAGKTINLLTEHVIGSYEELEEKTAAATKASDKLIYSIKSTEARIADLALLMKHAAAYRKLKPIYDSYRKSSDKGKYLRGHESDIILFEASASALKEMKIKKLPSAEKMKAEYKALAAEKEKLYAEYKTVRQEVREYSVIKQNVDSLLAAPKEQAWEKYTER